MADQEHDGQGSGGSNTGEGADPPPHLSLAVRRRRALLRAAADSLVAPTIVDRALFRAGTSSTSSAVAEDIGGGGGGGGSGLLASSTPHLSGPQVFLAAESAPDGETGTPVVGEGDDAAVEVKREDVLAARVRGVDGVTVRIRDRVVATGMLSWARRREEVEARSPTPSPRRAPRQALADVVAAGMSVLASAHRQGRAEQGMSPPPPARPVPPRGPLPPLASFGAAQGAPPPPSPQQVPPPGPLPPLASFGMASRPAVPPGGGLRERHR